MFCSSSMWHKKDSFCSVAPYNASIRRNTVFSSIECENAKDQTNQFSRPMLERGNMSHRNLRSQSAPPVAFGALRQTFYSLTVFKTYPVRPAVFADEMLLCLCTDKVRSSLFTLRVWLLAITSRKFKLFMFVYCAFVFAFPSICIQHLCAKSRR